METEKILLKIKREYTQEEQIAYLELKLKEKKFKIGELISELEEALHNNKVLSKELKDLNLSLTRDKTLRAEIACNLVIQTLKTELTKVKQELKTFNLGYKEYRDKYYTLKIKHEAYIARNSGT